MKLVEKKNFIINFAYFLTILAIIIISVKFLSKYLTPFLVGFIIAYFVQKPAEYFANKLRFKKQYIAAVLSVLTYAFIASFFCVFIWFVVINTNRFTEYIEAISDFFENFFVLTNQFVNKICSQFGGNFQTIFKQAIEDYIDTFTTKAINFLSSVVATIIRNMPTIFLTTIITIVSSCFFAKDFDKFIKFLKGIISDKTWENILTFKNIFFNSVVNFLISYAKIMLITFFELLIGFLILGVEQYVILAILISIIDLLPIVGTGTVLLPWAIISMLQKDFKIGIGITLLYVFICTMRNFLEPKIIGDKIGVNPLLTLITMFLGLKFFGFLGAIFLPLFFIVFFTFYRNKFT